MFKVDYLILQEEKSRISNLEVNTKWDVEGQICLDFNGEKIGFCEGEINVGSESLSLWFQKLLEVIKCLRKDGESYMFIPETTRILHFIICKGKIEVVERESVLKADNKGLMTYSFSDVSKIYWKEIIELENFEKEITQSVLRYIDEMLSYNKSFSSSLDYKKLIRLIG
jgi:hypothetical protein